MQAVIRIVSEGNLPVFGQFNAVYIGNPLKLEYQAEGKETIKLTVNNGDKVLIDHNPIDTILKLKNTEIKVNEYYDINCIGFITAANKNLPATITLTDLNFLYSDLDKE